jgi:hypothetical protein
MKILFSVIVFFAFISCQEESFSGNDYLFNEAGLVQNDTKNQEEVWVCHHPGTSFHNKECVEEQYPTGCYISGDRHKFCWLLFKKDCESPIGEAFVEACSHVHIR